MGNRELLDMLRDAFVDQGMSCIYLSRIIRQVEQSDGSKPDGVVITNLLISLLKYMNQHQKDMYKMAMTNQNAFGVIKSIVPQDEDES